MKSTQNNMKCTCPTPAPTPEGPTPAKFASPNAKDNNMLVFLALGNAKELSFALGDAKVPNANDFASQWNIGLRLDYGDFGPFCGTHADLYCLFCF